MTSMNDTVKGHTVKNTKKVLLATLAAGSMLALAACSGGAGGDSGEGGGDGGLIGVAMPTKSSERWIQDGDAVKEQLEEQGFTVDLQYAEDDIPTQVSQIENMITKGAEALIIASIDGTTLSQVLQDAADADIPVIAYDRLIRDSENVDYYASFDNFIVGVQQATSLLNGLGLTDLEGAPAADAPAGPFNIELFAGSPDDNNATFFWNGAIDTLQPLHRRRHPRREVGPDRLRAGRHPPLGRRGRAGAHGEHPDLDLLRRLHGQRRAVALRRPVARHHLGAHRRRLLASARAGRSSPARTPSSTRSRRSTRASSSRPSSRTPASSRRSPSTWPSAILNGEEPEVNNTEDYDNGVKVVPSYLLESAIVVKDNITEVLVDSGYWTEEEING